MAYEEGLRSQRSPEWWARMLDLRGGAGLTISQQQDLWLDYKACAKQVQALETIHRTEQDCGDGCIGDRSL